MKKKTTPHKQGMITYLERTCKTAKELCYLLVLWEIKKWFGISPKRVKYYIKQMYKVKENVFKVFHLGLASHR